MNITIDQLPIQVPEVFKFPRCPASDKWFGYILYADGTLEYMGEKMKATDENIKKVRDGIVKRIESEAVYKYLYRIRVIKYVDEFMNTMYSYNLYTRDTSDNEYPVRLSMNQKKLEVFKGNRWLTAHDFEKEEAEVAESESKEKWVMVRTRIGKDKLMKLIGEIIDGKNFYHKEVSDLKIHFCADGTYALHKTVDRRIGRNG